MQKKEYVTVITLAKKFNLEILYRGKTSNKIMIPSLNRTGIELASKKIVFSNIISAVLWSGNESKFLDQLKTPAKIKEAMTNVLKLNPPVIIVTKAFHHKEILLKVAKKYTTSVLNSEMPSSQLYVTVAAWINEQLAKYTTLHGTLVNIYGTGVLLLGKSGVGKSEVAMELVKKGHIFVADDAIDVANIAGRLLGKPNAVANNFIEVRGLGILNIPKMFGVEKTQTSSNVDVIIELVTDDNVNSQIFERIGNECHYQYIEKARISYYKLPISPGRKMSDLIESAVVDFKLKQRGYNSGQDFITNYNRLNKDERK
jgi:HPr kinase/phosphorylase